MTFFHWYSRCALMRKIDVERRTLFGADDLLREDQSEYRSSQSDASDLSTPRTSAATLKITDQLLPVLRHTFSVAGAFPACSTRRALAPCLISTTFELKSSAANATRPPLNSMRRSSKAWL